MDHIPKPAQDSLFDGLESRNRAVRLASMKALADGGVDLMDYSAELPRARRSMLRRSIQEMASFRQWWAENVA
jgi:hypothetical protein